MPISRDVALLRKSAAALRASGDVEAAAEIDRAVQRLEQPTSSHGADLDGVRQGLFRLREGFAEPGPRPQPPRHRPVD